MVFTEAFFSKNVYEVIGLKVVYQVFVLKIYTQNLYSHCCIPKLLSVVY